MFPLVACRNDTVRSASANNAVFRSDQLSRWMLPPTQILIQTSACSCPDASLSRLTITVPAELSAPHANILAIPSFLHPRPSFPNRALFSEFRTSSLFFFFFLSYNLIINYATRERLYSSGDLSHISNGYTRLTLTFFALINRDVAQTSRCGFLRPFTE